MHTKLCALFIPALLVGCATDGPTTGAYAANNTEANRYVPIIEEGDFPIHDVAADGERVFFARGVRGVQIHDAESLEPLEILRFTRGDEVLTDSEIGVAGEEGDLRIVADGVQTHGDDLVVWGVRDDTPLDPWGHAPSLPKNLVIQSLTTDHQLAWRLSLELAKSIYVPNLSVALDDDEIVIAVGHEAWTDQLIVLDVPSPGDDLATKLLEAEGGRSYPLDVYPHGVAMMDEGYLVPAGVHGLLAVGPDGAATTLSDDEALSYVVDAHAVGSLAYVADHDFGFHVLSLATGEVQASVEVPDDVYGIEVTEDHVYVNTREGVFVAPVASSGTTDQE